MVGNKIWRNQGSGRRPTATVALGRPHSWGPVASGWQWFGVLVTQKMTGLHELWQKMSSKTESKQILAHLGFGWFWFLDVFSWEPSMPIIPLGDPIEKHGTLRLRSQPCSRVPHQPSRSPFRLRHGLVQWWFNGGSNCGQMEVYCFFLCFFWILMMVNGVLLGFFWILYHPLVI